MTGTGLNQSINIIQVYPGLAFDLIRLLRLCKSLEDPQVHGGPGVLAHLQKLHGQICYSVRICQLSQGILLLDRILLIMVKRHVKCTRI